MILHCVFFTFRSDAPQDARRAVLTGLAELCADLEGVLAFESGPNLDFEGKSQDYRDGFVIRFADRTAVKAYAEHPTHRRLGGQLCDLCQNGADGIIVFDLDVPDAQ
ncbi:Dabb family protein [Ruegeria arenilitoris]|uniref:Dabb family protein n=1 Tax=Ruegeria arenilitoris TaxID=1173585 RepID=UPI00147F04F0|nr:Dabb family protein [Ruegeria arenilitoris]